MNREIKRSGGNFIKKISPYLLISLSIFLLTGCGGPTVVGRAPLTSGASVEIVQIPLRLSNVFLVRTRVPILVDTGTIGDMQDLDDALAERNVATSSIGLVVVTHGHADHAGLAADIQKLARAPIILGAGDAQLAAAGRNDDLKPTGFTGAFVKPLITSIYPELFPDVLVKPGEPFDLSPWGLAGKVVAMPGHTPGSIVVLLDDHSAFVGDMIAGGLVFGPRSPQEHLYQADPAQNRKNIQTLLDQGVEKFYLGHGGPVLRKDVIAAFGMH
jgi:glyoxylase-like metal-dependent hydrolase (beta-lactamase superfamily II)